MVCAFAAQGDSGFFLGSDVESKKRILMNTLEKKCSGLAMGFFVVATMVVGIGLTPATSSAILVTLQDLENGQTLVVNDKLFDQWDVTVTTTGTGTGPLDKIEVTLLGDDPLNPGLKFTNMKAFDPLGLGLGVFPGPGSVTMDIHFRVSTLSGAALIKDNSLLINGFVFDSNPPASITIEETIQDATGNELGTKLAFANNNSTLGDASLFDEANFAPQSEIFVWKQIFIDGLGTNDGVFLTMFEQRFSQVPEPTSLILASLGLLGIGWRRRKRA